MHWGRRSLWRVALVAACLAAALLLAAAALAIEVRYFNGYMPVNGQDTDIYESQSSICGFEWVANSMDKSDLYTGQVVFIDGSGNWYLGAQGYGNIGVLAGPRNDKPLCRNNYWQGYNALCYADYQRAPPGHECV
jgi:hypothetical protein